MLARLHCYQVITELYYGQTMVARLQLRQYIIELYQGQTMAAPLPIFIAMTCHISLVAEYNARAPSDNSNIIVK